MLLGIRRPDERDAPSGPAERLLACHDRIRRFAGLAVTIASSPSVAADEIAQAARSVHRYFTVALPLHEADEDESIRPRLLATPGLEPALETVRLGHRATDELLAALAPLWVEAAAGRAGARELATGLGSARALDELFRRHLALEESTVIPALARFSPEERTRSFARWSGDERVSERGEARDSSQEASSRAR